MSVFPLSFFLFLFLFSLFPLHNKGKKMSVFPLLKSYFLRGGEEAKNALLRSAGSRPSSEFLNCPVSEFLVL